VCSFFFLAEIEERDKKLELLRTRSTTRSCAGELRPVTAQRMVIVELGDQIRTGTWFHRDPDLILSRPMRTGWRCLYRQKLQRRVEREDRSTDGERKNEQ